MMSRSFPEFITNWPQVDVPLEGVRGWLLQGERQQAVFFEIDPTAEVPVHTHGEQWGIVVEGELELTINGQTRRCRAGDSYHIPAGAPHSARFLSRVRVIDVFADADRYRAKA
jgi:quercetin dioxygenase-like cupin family protein